MSKNRGMHFHEWRRGVVVITTTQLQTSKPELRFCAGSNPIRGVSEICDGEDLLQWSRLEIKINVFRWSTILQKYFIIIIIIILLSKIRHLAKLTNASVIDMNETKLCGSTLSNEVAIEGYHLITLDRF